jgi:nucleotide-binding universal stress UspA family protein
MAAPSRRRVIVGVDGRPESRTALRLAVDEARYRHCPLQIVRSVEMYDEIPESAELDDAVAFAREDLGFTEVSGLVASGFPAAALLDQAAGAELLVVGSRPRSAIASVVLGSVGSAVATHAPCPVIVARTSGEHAVRAARVVVGVDGSESSDRAIDFAFGEASHRGTGLVAVHCWQVDHPTASRWNAEAFADRRNEHLRWMSESLAGFQDKYPEVRVSTSLLEGRAAVLLTELSRGAGLVVVGSRGRGGLVGMLLGSVSQSLLHHAYCSVAVVRPVVPSP